MSENTTGLVRSLSLRDAVMIGVASMIGGAIFVLIGPGISAAGPILIVAFLLNGIITLFTALTYAELSSVFPATGGGYVWVREGLPRPNSFLSGWMAWFGHTIAGSLYAIAFGSFLGYLLKVLEVVGDDFPLEKIFGIIAIVGFTYINFKGASSTGKVGNLITFAQIGIIIVLMIAAGYAITVNPNWTDNFIEFAPSGVLGLVIAMGLTFIAFEGYEIISQAGDEIKNPKKNIPRAIILSLAIVITLYVLFSLLFISALDPAKIGVPSWKFIGDFGELGIAEAARHIMPYGMLVVLGGGMISTLAALNATTFASSRVSFAMGKQYNLPSIFGKIHPKHNTPFISILISGVMMILMVATLDLTAIALTASVMFLFLFTQVNLASIVIRRMYSKKLDYGFKTPFFPLFPITGMLLAAGLAIYLLFTYPQSWIIAVFWIIIGFLIYKFYTSKKELEHYSPTIFTQGPSERQSYRIMILYNEKTAKQFFEIAKAIAPAQDSEVSFLNVRRVPDQIPLTLAHGLGESATTSFNSFKRTINGSIRNRYIIRLSHDITEAVLATAEEQAINILLVDFAFLKDNQKLLSLSTCDVLGIRVAKKLALKNIMLVYDKDRHFSLGMRISSHLEKKNDSSVRIVRITEEKPEVEHAILGRINESMFDYNMRAHFESITPRRDKARALLANATKYDTDVIVMGTGAKSDVVFNPTYLNILKNFSGTAIFVRNHRFSEIHARSFWDLLLVQFEKNRHVYRLYVEVFNLLNWTNHRLGKK